MLPRQRRAVRVGERFVRTGRSWGSGLLLRCAGADRDIWRPMFGRETHAMPDKPGADGGDIEMCEDSRRSVDALLVHRKEICRRGAALFWALVSPQRRRPCGAQAVVGRTLLRKGLGNASNGVPRHVGACHWRVTFPLNGTSLALDRSGSFVC
jgi:hypothetical protein